MNLIKRRAFPNIVKLVTKEKVLILQGGRRVGKSSLLLLVEDWLIHQGKRTLYYDLAYPGAPTNLNTDLAAKGISVDQPIYVLVDNWQESFPKDLNKNVHIVGASSLKTTAYKTIEILPLSFTEFLEFKGEKTKGNSRWAELYREFLTYGGYPEVVLEPQIERKKQLLWQIIDIYLRKDMGDLGQVKDMNKLIRLLKVLAGQVGQVADMMALSRETGLSFPTLKKYLAVLDKAFLIQMLRPFSLHPAVEIAKSPKFYFSDSGLMSMLWLNGFSPTMLEPIFKTNIFGELIKKIGREAVAFWRSKAGAEVDFIVKKNSLILAIDAAINFQGFSSKNITLFKKRYNPKRWRLIGLEGEKLKKNGFYPWEM